MKDIKELEIIDGWSQHGRVTSVIHRFRCCDSVCPLLGVTQQEESFTCVGTDENHNDGGSRVSGCADPWCRCTFITPSDSPCSSVLLMTNKEGFSQQNEAECVNIEWRRSLEGGRRTRPASEAAMLKSKLRSAGTAQGHHDYGGRL